MSEDALDHLEELPLNISHVDLPGNEKVAFLYLTEDRLYAATNLTLYVFYLSDLTCPIATYPILNFCS